MRVSGFNGLVTCVSEMARAERVEKGCEEHIVIWTPTTRADLVGHRSIQNSFFLASDPKGANTELKWNLFNSMPLLHMQVFAAYAHEIMNNLNGVVSEFLIYLIHTIIFIVN